MTPSHAKSALTRRLVWLQSQIESGNSSPGGMLFVKQEYKALEYAMRAIDFYAEHRGCPGGLEEWIAKKQQMAKVMIPTPKELEKIRVEVAELCPDCGCSLPCRNVEHREGCSFIEEPSADVRFANAVVQDGSTCENDPWYD